MGLATAKLLASQGATIALADINQDNLTAALKSLPYNDQHMITVVDVRKSDVVDAWISSIIQKHNKLDGAVNMAGIITKATPITEMTDEDVEFSLAVNTKGVFNCLRAQLRAMGAGGSIVSPIVSGHFAGT